MKKIFSVISLIIFAYGCAGLPTPLPEPESRSAIVYREKCGACHSVPHPRRNTYPQWENLVKLMEKNMAHRGMAVLTVEEKETILSYLKNHAR